MKYLTHPAFKDVFIEVVRIQYQDAKRVKAKIIWWNRSQTGKPFTISQVETREFTRAKWKEFIPYIPSRLEQGT